MVRDEEEDDELISKPSFPAEKKLDSGAFIYYNLNDSMKCIWRGAMKTVTIRGIDPELDRIIKTRAQQNNLSVNQWILQALRKVTGTGKEPVFKKHHDLDALAGGWSKEELKEFARNTGIFEQIDEELWK